MEAIKRVRWQRVVPVLLVLLIIVVGIVTVERRAGTSQLLVGGTVTVTVTVTATRVSQPLQLAPQPTHIRTSQLSSSPTPTLSPSPTTSSNSPQWQLIFSDDFNGSSLDSGWGAYNGPHGGGQSFYSPLEVKVQNGLLQLGMERKAINGLLYTTGGVGAFHYIQTYGKYEFRVRLPYGKGVGPYAILWPQNGDPSAQVDIFESPPVDKSTLYFTNHGGPGGVSTQLRAHGSFTTGFHTLTCIWLPGKLQFLVDGISQGILTRNVPHQPMFFGIAVESGDAFVGLPDSTTILPIALEVDWVHIYAYKG